MTIIYARLRLAVNLSLYSENVKCDCCWVDGCSKARDGSVVILCYVESVRWNEMAR